MDDTSSPKSALRPSFFELVATEQLGNSLKPALQFLLEVLSPRHRVILWLSHNVDEVYLTLMSGLELSSLRRDAGLVSETFYSLRRASSYRDKSLLPPRSVIASIFWSVIIPYLRMKLENIYNSLRSNPISSPSLSFRGIPTRLPRLVRLLLAFRRVLISREAREVYLKAYRVVVSIADAASLLCKFAYLLELLPYFSPSMLIQRLVLRRLTATEASGPTLPKPKSYTQHALRVTDAIATAVKYTAFAALVAYRFLEYYHQAEDEVPNVQTPVPPPPQPLRPNITLPESPNDCPICGNVRVTPAALSKSGYVFCYECILKYVRESSRCPVTNVRVQRSHIWRVYHAEA